MGVAEPAFQAVELAKLRLFLAPLLGLLVPFFKKDEL